MVPDYRSTYRTRFHPLPVLPAGILLAPGNGTLAHDGLTWVLTPRFHRFYTYHVRIW